MEKNGVVLDDELNKVASMRGRPCPQCGSTHVNYAGLTPNCPQCGSEPWEPKEKKNGPTQSQR
jgi:uncharacterized Zn finger protein (UPF0148 family)